MISHGSMNMICYWNFCSSSFLSEKELFDHIEYKHLSRLHFPGSNACKWKGCSFSTMTRFRLKTHMKAHVPYKNYACPKCSNAFKHKGYNRHVLLVHGLNFRELKKPDDCQRRDSKFCEKEEDSDSEINNQIEDDTPVSNDSYRLETLSYVARLLLN